MNFRMTAIGATAALAFAASPVLAQDMMGMSLEGVYVGIGGGGNKPLDQEFEAPIPLGPVTPGIVIEGESEWGWLAGAMVGYRFGNGLRVELEGMYRDNDVDELQFGGLVNVNAVGDTDVTSGMLNVLYDLDFGSSIVPYIGAGAGVAYVRYNDVSIAGLPAPFNVIAYDDEQWAAAVQGIVGASYKLTPELDLFADYRFFSTIGLDSADNPFPPVAGVPIAIENEDEYQTHSVLVGLRYTFGAPAPAPMPAAEPAPAPEPAMVPRNFLVFFEWDRSDLTAEAKGIIADAAAYAAQGGVSRIHLTGHTDTSGAADYNVGLSQRRAESVKTELVSVHSMNPDAISTAWRGESDPLVATGDGVREPQNRRVEIVFP